MVFLTKPSWFNYRCYPCLHFSNNALEQLFGIFYIAYSKSMCEFYGNFSWKWAKWYSRNKRLWKLLGSLWKNGRPTLLCPWFLLARLLPEQHSTSNVYWIVTWPLYENWKFFSDRQFYKTRSITILKYKANKYFYMLPLGYFHSYL